MVTATALPQPADSDRRRLRPRPGVRFILGLVVLLPMLATVVLAGSRLTAASTFRRQAELVASDAARLQQIASARVRLNTFAVPLETVAYATSVGLSTVQLDAVLEPSVPFAAQVDQTTADLAEFPVFASETLRSHIIQLHAVSQRVASNSISPAEVGAAVSQAQADVDRIWNTTYDGLRAHISAWSSSGSFGLQASTLTQIYQAFLSGGEAMRHAALILEGNEDPSARLGLFEAHGSFVAATDQFVRHLGSRGQVAWDAMQADPSRQEFTTVIDQASTIALDDGASPYAGDPVAAGVATERGLAYVNALDGLVIAASQDLRDAALGRASGATAELRREAVLMAVLAVVVATGVVVAGRVLTRPLMRLAARAQQVSGGEFDLVRLPESGARETVVATAAFNEMASTLKGVETRALALAAEDFSHPDLGVQLPGRTGRALQASIDSLTAQIHERERQRVLLHESATHDKATGLLNRGAVMDYLTHDVTRRRRDGETVAVLFLDLDGLKRLNDTYGHEIGDAAITATADAILACTSICDVVGRLGGDEFLIVLCHRHSGDGDDIATRVNATLAAQNLRVGALRIPMTASVGIALARCDAETDPAALVRQADAAMYLAKRQARAAREQLATSPR